MTLLLILSTFLIAGMGAILFLLTRKKDNTSELLLRQQVDFLKESLDSSTRLIHEQMGRLTREMGDRLQQSAQSFQEANKQVGDRLDNAARVVGDVQRTLGRMEESNRQIFDVGRDISKLQDILKAPKLRGNLGELFLGDLLAQVLPTDRYALQYEFKSREKVDAVVFTVQGMIPVDSKFPLENFLKILQSGSDEEKRAARKQFLADVKKHIDKIAQKYVLPEEGTLELALMYVPAENVYYEILIRQEDGEKDLLRYAQEKHVYPVSPNSFYAYLQTIALGFKGLKIEERAREIMKDLSALKKDFGDFSDGFRLVGKHLSNARSAFDDADKRVQKLGDRMETLSAGQQTAEGASLKLVDLKEGRGS